MSNQSQQDFYGNTDPITEMVYSISEEIEWNCIKAIALCRRILAGHSDLSLLSELDSAVVEIEGADYLTASDEDFVLTKNLKEQDGIRFITMLLTEVNMHRLCAKWAKNIQG
jgi:hypothetical protein